MNPLPERCNDCHQHIENVPELGYQCAHPERKYRVYLNPEERATKCPDDCPLLPKLPECCGECDAIETLPDGSRYCREMEEYAVILVRSEIEKKRSSFCPRNGYQRSVRRA